MDRNLMTHATPGPGASRPPVSAFLLAGAVIASLAFPPSRTLAAQAGSGPGAAPGPTGPTTPRILQTERLRGPASERTDARVVSRAGLLEGIEDLEPGSRIELLPYTAGRVAGSPGDPQNPFWNDTDGSLPPSRPSFRSSAFSSRRERESFAWESGSGTATGRIRASSIPVASAGPPRAVRPRAPSGPRSLPRPESFRPGSFPGRPGTVGPSGS